MDPSGWSNQERFMAAAMFSIYHKAWAAADGTCYSPIDLYSAAN